MIANRDRLAASEAREIALECVEAGIEAGHPRTVVRDTVALEGETLRIADATYDLREYDALVVLGGGNAAAHVAVALEAILGDRIDGGVVVTDDPVETERVTVRWVTTRYRASAASTPQAMSSQRRPRQTGTRSCWRRSPAAGAPHARTRGGPLPRRSPDDH